MTWVWSTWNNGSCEHEDTCCGLRAELGAIKFRTLLHILHHLAEIVLYLHIADVGGGRQQTPQICQAAAAASSQRCAATYKLGVQNISCICNFYPEFIFLHLREKEPISAAKSFNIIGSLKKITYVLDLHRYTAIFILHGPEPFYICYFLHFQLSLIHFAEGMFDI